MNYTGKREKVVWFSATVQRQRCSFLPLVLAPSSSSSSPGRWQCVHALLRFHVCPGDSIRWGLLSSLCDGDIYDPIESAPYDVDVVWKEKPKRAGEGGSRRDYGEEREDRLHRFQPCVCSALFLRLQFELKKAVDTRTIGCAAAVMASQLLLSLLLLKLFRSLAHLLPLSTFLRPPKLFNITSLNFDDVATEPAIYSKYLYTFHVHLFHIRYPYFSLYMERNSYSAVIYKILHGETQVYSFC